MSDRGPTHFPYKTTAATNRADCIGRMRPLLIFKCSNPLLAICIGEVRAEGPGMPFQVTKVVLA